jgi:hypothetical protein
MFREVYKKYWYSFVGPQRRRFSLVMIVAWFRDLCRAYRYIVLLDAAASPSTPKDHNQL